MKKVKTLRESFNNLTTSLRIPTPVCVRVDEVPAFQSLSKCAILKELGIAVETGRTKNHNKNAVVAKAINKFEKEITRLDFTEKPISSSTLSLSRGLNNRIRFNGLSSREIPY